MKKRGPKAAHIRGGWRCAVLHRRWANHYYTKGKGRGYSTRYSRIQGQNKDRELLKELIMAQPWILQIHPELEELLTPVGVL